MLHDATYCSSVRNVVGFGKITIGREIETISENETIQFEDELRLTNLNYCVMNAVLIIHYCTSYLRIFLHNVDRFIPSISAAFVLFPPDCLSAWRINAPSSTTVLSKNELCKEYLF